MPFLSSIEPAALPPDALLRAYEPIGYADCFVTELPFAASIESFVEAFYTTPLFKLERAVLRWLASKPSSDEEAQALARGGLNAFAAWTVEGRASNQILLADMTGRTRSWLMASALNAPDGTPATRLYFGSALVPRKDERTGRATMGPGFHALLGFHNLYSRLLLRAARSRLRQTAADQALEDAAP